MKRKWEDVNEKSVGDAQSSKKARLGTRLANLGVLRAGLKCNICNTNLSGRHFRNTKDRGSRSIQNQMPQLPLFQ